MKINAVLCYIEFDIHSIFSIFSLNCHSWTTGLHTVWWRNLHRIVKHKILLLAPYISRSSYHATRVWYLAYHFRPDVWACSPSAHVNKVRQQSDDLCQAPLPKPRHTSTSSSSGHQGVGHFRPLSHVPSFQWIQVSDPRFQWVQNDCCQRLSEVSSAQGRQFCASKERHHWNQADSA